MLYLKKVKTFQGNNQFANSKSSKETICISCAYYEMNGTLTDTTQPPRVRQFCVEIAPPYDWRNIDAALLREHSVRRICASYKVLQICANLTHALTYASNLRKKNPEKNCACAKKK